MEAGMTIAAAGSATTMRNEHGVTVRLLSSQQGLRFQFAPGGVQIALKPS